MAVTKPSSSSSTSSKPTKRSSLSNVTPAADNDSLLDDADVDAFGERVPLDAGFVPVSAAKAATKGKKGKGKAKEDAAMAVDEADEDDSVMLDTSAAVLPSAATAEGPGSAAGAGAASGALDFPAVSHKTGTNLTQNRKISIPPHRMTPLKRDWVKVYTPLVEECGLLVRMNVKKRYIELKTSKHTESPSALSKAADFLNAYSLGFAVEDAIALLRLEELYIESFEIKDVKTLHGDHLSRAIGRIAGHEGKTRFIIENASRTRVVLADTRIHILGTFANIKIARDAICNLILGSPPGKIYAGLRIVASRAKERF